MQLRPKGSSCRATTRAINSPRAAFEPLSEKKSVNKQALVACKFRYAKISVYQERDDLANATLISTRDDLPVSGRNSAIIFKPDQQRSKRSRRRLNSVTLSVWMLVLESR